jgi:uncharacterized protein RhaS with RHS repeats
VDSNGNVRQMLLDQAGQEVSGTDGAGPLPAVTRNAANRVTTAINGRGQVSTFA